jgi:hypothetical protein
VLLEVLLDQSDTGDGVLLFVIVDHLVHDFRHQHEESVLEVTPLVLGPLRQIVEALDSLDISDLLL